MNNIQLVDSLDGGYFAFKRNDYPIDEGIYTELYATFFGTSSAEWWADGAFEISDFNISSRTGITLKNNSSTSDTNISLIKKAVQDDLTRFTNKNPNISVQNMEVFYWSKTILIIVELTGFNDAFNFIYQKTKESIENADFKTY